MLGYLLGWDGVGCDVTAVVGGGGGGDGVEAKWDGKAGTRSPSPDQWPVAKCLAGRQG